mgnify:CR=1 FL=1
MMNLPVIPAPSSVVTGNDSFRLPAELDIAFADPRLAAAASLIRNETAHVVRTAAGASFVVTLELVSSDSELAALPATAGVRADVAGAIDERYGLEVSVAGIRIWGLTPEGVFRGASTAVQMIAAATGVELQSVRILDNPRFAWRGLSLDVARTFFSTTEVKSIIDMMTRYKFNVLHLHLSDDQGWRLEIEGWPRLTEVGGAGAAAGRPGGFYSVQEYTDLVQYASDRFVTVVPELDMPGHSTATFVAYPELAQEGWQPPTAENPVAMGYFDPANEGTWQFVADVFGSLAKLTPGEYIHLGGDEAFGMPADKHAEFITKAIEVARSMGKKVVGWQEAARGDVACDTIVENWIDPVEIRETMDSPEVAAMLPAEMIDAMKAVFAEAGHDVEKALAKGAWVLLAPNSGCYLDRKYSEASADPSQVAATARLGMPFYKPKTVRDSYEWTPDQVDVQGQTDRIAGVEAAIWCETIENFDDLTFMLLPRLPGIAERAWSQASEDAWDAYSQRLALHAEMWRRNGWNYFKSELVKWD